MGFGFADNDATPSTDAGPPNGAVQAADEAPRRQGSEPSIKRMKSSGRIKVLAREESGFEWRNGFSFAALVRSTPFELACCLLIGLNTVSSAVEMQYSGCMLAHAINHPDCLHRGWSGAEAAFTAISVIFGVLYIAEFVLRLMALRLQALMDCWMWMDFLLIAFGTMDVIQRLGGDLAIGINPTWMRTLRFVRMVKMIKCVGPDHRFSSLFLVARSVQVSRNALGWTIAILLVVMSCIGMMMGQLLQGHITDGSLSIAERHELFDYFGTFSRMLITMCELTLGNWAPPSRLLMSRVGEAWGLFIIAYRCIFCFAIVNISAAVFITETNRAAAGDDEVAMMRKKKAKEVSDRKILEVFYEIDTSGDGAVNWDEFQEALANPVMRQYLSTLDLDVVDLESLFKLLDDGDGMVQSEEFVRGLSTLRGQAKNVDLLTLMKNVEKMGEIVERLAKGLLIESCTVGGRIRR